MKFRSYLFLSFTIYFVIGCSTVSKEEKLSRMWVRSTETTDYNGEHLGLPFQPVLYKNKLISANSVDGLIAFNKKFGTKIWNLKIPGGISSPATLVSDYLFFTAYDGYAYSVSANDGKVFWKKDIKYPSVQSLFYESGRLYIHTNNSEILALEAASGEKIWSFNKKNQRKISVGGIGEFLPLGSLMIVGMSNGELVALEKANGKIRWQRKLNFNSRFRDLRTLTLFDTDKILVAGYDDHIYNVDAVSGALKWKRKFSVVTNFINLKDNEVCFGTADLEIKCINPTVGSETKNVKISSISGQITKVNDHKILYGLSKGGIEFLDFNTGKKTTYITSSGILNAPVWNEKKSEVYFNSNAGNTYVLKLHKELKPEAGSIF